MAYTPPSGRTDHLTTYTQPSTTTQRNQVQQKPARVQTPTSHVGVQVIPKTQTQPTNVTVHELPGSRNAKVIVKK